MRRMVRAHFCVSMGLSLMLAAAKTEAGQLEFFVENRLGGTDNVFERANDSGQPRKSDGFWEVAPRVVVSDVNGEFEYDFRYQPTFQKFFTETNVAGWDQKAQGRLDWRITPRDVFEASGSFSSARQVREEIIDGGVDPDPAVEPSDRQRINRGRSRFSFSHGFTQALSSRVEYSLDDLDYSVQSVSDSRAHTGSLGLNYTLGSLTSIGVTGSVRFRNARVNSTTAGGDVIQEISSRSRSIDMSFSVRRRLSKTIDLSAQAGPSFIDTQQERQITGATAKLKSYSKDQSVFAAVSATKKWRKGKLTLTYTRHESGAGGTASSSIVDDLVILGSYRHDRQWSMSANASWSLLTELADDLSGGIDQEVTRFRVFGTVSRKVLPQLDVVARFHYRIQSQRQTGRDTDNENMTGWLGLQYNFDPIVF